MGVRVSQVKPSNCFRLHHTSMISKHSTIPVPDSVQAPRKISFTFHFLQQSFIFDNFKLAELSNNSFEWNSVTYLGAQNILWPSYIFSGGQDPQVQDLYAPGNDRKKTCFVSVTIRAVGLWNRGPRARRQIGWSPTRWLLMSGPLRATILIWCQISWRQVSPTHLGCVQPNSAPVLERSTFPLERSSVGCLGVHQLEQQWPHKLLFACSTSKHAN